MVSKSLSLQFLSSHASKYLGFETLDLEICVLNAHIFYHGCSCGNCDIALMINENECYCCCELDECQVALNSEEVLKDLAGAKVKCITQHPGFNPVCLQKWSLRS